MQGALTGMMMTLKGLPLAYNKDMQEDKEGLFDTLDTWLDCLHMATLVPVSYTHLDVYKRQAWYCAQEAAITPASFAESE